MNTPVTRPPSTAAGPDQGVTARRIRFVAEAPAGASVRRVFKQPGRTVAVEEAVELADLPARAAWPEPTDYCYVVFVPAGVACDWLQSAGAWMAGPDEPEA